MLYAYIRNRCICIHNQKVTQNAWTFMLIFMKLLHKRTNLYARKIFKIQKEKRIQSSSPSSNAQKNVLSILCRHSVRTSSLLNNEHSHCLATRAAPANPANHETVREDDTALTTMTLQSRHRCRSNTSRATGAAKDGLCRPTTERTELSLAPLTKFSSFPW